VSTTKKIKGFKALRLETLFSFLAKLTKNTPQMHPLIYGYNPIKCCSKIDPLQSDQRA